MTNIITQNKLNSAPLLGFETNHRYYHSNRSERWVFNALRIASYLPLVGGISSFVVMMQEIRTQGRRIHQLSVKLKQTDFEIQQFDRNRTELIAAKEEFDKTREQTSGMIEAVKTSIIEGDAEQLVQNSSQNLLSVIDQNHHQLLQTAPELLASLEALKKSRNDLKLDDANHEDALMLIERNKQAIRRLFIRFIVSILWLGVVFLPFDLYHTEWRARNVKLMA